MKYNTALFLVFILGTFCYGNEINRKPEASTTNAQIVGEAYDKKSKELIYREYHYFYENQHYVAYKSPNNQLKVEKSLEYPEGNLLIPSFIQHNELTKQQMSVQHQDKVVFITQGKRSKTLSSRAPYPLVIDAGFDHFIQQYWQTLVSGKPEKFSFVFAKRLSIVHMQAKNIDCTAEGKTTSKETIHYCFTLTPTNLAFKLFSTPIELTYNSEKQLINYKGISNIELPSGKTPSVNIQYHYPPTSNESGKVASYHF